MRHLALAMKKLRSAVAAPMILSTIFASSAAAQTDSKIRPDDVLAITILGQPDLDGKYAVEPSGTLDFPFIGRVDVTGLTPRELAAELRRRLGDGYFKDPRVTIQLERTRRVFIFGGVGAPGTYELTENMTLIEALALAGYGAASEAVIVRRDSTKGPVVPSEAVPSEVINVNLREFEKDVEAGRLSRNVVLADGDAIFVPRIDRNRLFVSGEVRSPGAYSVPEGTTVLQALTLAGGVTEYASTGRIRIIRLLDGEKQTIRVKLDDVVHPGDTILVPEKFF